MFHKWVRQMRTSQAWIFLMLSSFWRKSWNHLKPHLQTEMAMSLTIWLRTFWSCHNPFSLSVSSSWIMFTQSGFSSSGLEWWISLSWMIWNPKWIRSWKQIQIGWWKSTKISQRRILLNRLSSRFDCRWNLWIIKNINFIGFFEEHSVNFKKEFFYGLSLT